MKLSLRTIVRNDAVYDCINSLAIKMNTVMIHTLFFIKLFMLRNWEENQFLNYDIDENLCRSIMRTICPSPNQRGPRLGAENQVLMNTLQAFYINEYRILCPANQEELTALGTTQIMSYMATEIVTMYKNNIVANYIAYITQFVEVHHQLPAFAIIDGNPAMNNYAKKNEKLRIKLQIKRIVDDIINKRLDDGIKSSHVQYHEWINANIRFLVPQRLTPNGFAYDLKAHPFFYFPYIVYMQLSLEEMDIDIKLFNVFPLKTTLIPGHIRIDTQSVIAILASSKDPISKRIKDDPESNNAQEIFNVWNESFALDKPVFNQNGFDFNNMIQTDGTSVSILFVRSNTARTKTGKPIVRKVKIPDEVYIDGINDRDKAVLRTKKLVAIDPNMRDLLYCVDGNDGDAGKFRYTQDQRRKELKIKKNRKVLMRKRKAYRVNGRSVESIESDLSHYNSKSLSGGRYEAYLIAKLRVNLELAEFYERPYHRRLKMTQFMRKQQTEAHLMNNFRSKFHPNDPASNVVVCFGDWSEQTHRRFHEPVKGIGFRNLFRKAGYHVYLVDEFRTSIKCSVCSDPDRVVENFRYCKNPRPNKANRILRHGLLRCIHCRRLWNRDVNAAKNIWKIANAALENEARPLYLQRGRAGRAGQGNHDGN